MTSNGCCAEAGRDLILALNCCEGRLQFVLGRDEPGGMSLLAAQEWTVPGRSVRFLTPAVRGALELLEEDVRRIGRIACVRGPGSFTGIRLVLAAAAGLRAAQGALLAGLDYLLLLARAPLLFPDGRVYVLTHARRGLVHIQGFEASAGEAAPVTPLQVLGLEQACALVRSGPIPCRLLGSGVRRYRDRFEDLAAGHPGIGILPPLFDHPAPGALLLAASRAIYSPAPVEPSYQRPSDAEQNLGSIAAGRGMDPGEAEARLDLCLGKQG